MKKILVLLSAVMLFAHVSFGANFQPALLKLSAPTSISYEFDGSLLNIPVTVSGTDAGVIFCVYTNGQAASIKKVKNGFLGWHYVNKVDTSIYIRHIMPFSIGKSTITWNGKDDDGGLVAAGTYTYYLFGYNNTGGKTKVSSYMTNRGGVGGNIAHIQEIGPDGKVLANPLFYGIGGTTKWTIGNDPEDSTLVETTRYSLGSGYSAARTISFKPDDFSRYFLRVANTVENIHGVRKMIWVPNGVSTFDLSWGDNGICKWSETSYSIGNQPGTETLGDHIYTGQGQGRSQKPVAFLCVISTADGTLEKKIDLIEWWGTPEQAKAGHDMVDGPGGIDTRNGFLLLSSLGSCFRQLLDPSAEDIEDLVVWVNGNGDYVLDKNDTSMATKKWYCNDYDSGPYTYNLSPDANMFSIAPAYDMGAVSFGLLAPDGDGVGYFAFAGESAAWKMYTLFVDSGSAFDGIYCDNQSISKLTLGAEYIPGLFYIAHDSIKGIISNAVAVKEAAPLVFSVAQNTPNPFNPSTTIHFSLAKPGRVTVDVYNAAGQKIDTLLNSVMGAGEHSVTWNGAKFAAGMYFYTVTSGTSTRTMKMTLLK